MWLDALLVIYLQQDKIACGGFGVAGGEEAGFEGRDSGIEGFIGGAEMKSMFHFGLVDALVGIKYSEMRLDGEDFGLFPANHGNEFRNIAITMACGNKFACG